MGLYGLLTTSASGMSAQSALLNTVSDNISNVSTTGYKRSSAEFSSMVLSSGLTADYQSGSVMVNPRIAIDGQGALNGTTSTTDLAIKGDGFFVVQGPNGQPVLTRAGSFVKDSSGDLVNSAGYTLMGYPAGSVGVANGFAGLVPINLNSIALQATPTTSGKLYVNLPSNSTVVTPATNAVPSVGWATTSPTPTTKTSLVTYDNLGNQVTLDIYMTNLGADPVNPNRADWDISIFNAADATNGTFPYKNPAANEPLASGTLQFSKTTGALTSGSPISLNIPNGRAMTLDMSQTTQLATSYTILTASTNGNAPSQVSGVTIGKDGTVSVAYQNGASAAVYDVPLAKVTSPDKMTVISGNAFIPGLQSGAAQIGAAGSGGLGSIQSSALEASTVDLASELTTMIEAQNNYQADSKVFTTGSQLLQVLINLGH